jgi:hypothetical protein
MRRHAKTAKRNHLGNTIPRQSTGDRSGQAPYFTYSQSRRSPIHRTPHAYCPSLGRPGLLRRWARFCSHLPDRGGDTRPSRRRILPPARARHPPTQQTDSGRPDQRVRTGSVQPLPTIGGRLLEPHRYPTTATMHRPSLPSRLNHGDFFSWTGTASSASGLRGLAADAGDGGGRPASP